MTSLRSTPSGEQADRLGRLWRDAITRMDARYDPLIYRNNSEACLRLRAWAHERWMQLFVEYQIEMGWLPAWRLQQKE